MRPLCFDQPEALTQGCYYRVDFLAISAALRIPPKVNLSKKHLTMWAVPLTGVSLCGAVWRNVRVTRRYYLGEGDLVSTAGKL